MITATGKSILKGIAIGKVKFFKKEQAKISDVVSDVETELKKFEKKKKKGSNSASGTL